MYVTLLQQRLGNAIRLSAIRGSGSESAQPQFKIPKQQQKSPTMFSLNSLSFWMSACTTHIGRVARQHVQVLFFVPGPC